jgi:cold shock protein
MAKGIIRRVFEHQGFGYIQTEDGHDFFFHRSDIFHIPFEALREGQMVEFTLVVTPQGSRAWRLSVMEAHSAPQGEHP